MSIHRLLFDPNLRQGEVKIAKLPLLIGFDGMVGESDSIRGLLNILIKEYSDAEDENDDWHLRVKLARSECMKALAYGIDAVVYDEEFGIIKNNYAADISDSDYEVDNEVDNILKIYINDEKKFLLSLIELGVIKILERDDSFYFKSDNKVLCEECNHRLNNVCGIYKSKILDMNGYCASGTNSNLNEREDGKYHEVQANKSNK
ncbi:hypothetical protein [Clostridium hydrogeniformans]|uniref:hypothetical protein n=1 Tax=Clostridium hydrogeniformans TaxID=349933 RepID=UPI0004897DEE|nr:hypothetical protein [Clostridium hydrogeniformans]